MFTVVAYESVNHRFNTTSTTYRCNDVVKKGLTLYGGSGRANGKEDHYS